MRERGLAGGIFNACNFVGSGAAPVIVAWLALHFSWRMAFMVASSLGFSGSSAGSRSIRNSSIRAASEPAGPRWKSGRTLPCAGILEHRQTWGLIFLRSLTGPLSHFYWFWLPEYLSSARGLSLEQLGRVVWIPYLFGGLGNVLGRIHRGATAKARPQRRSQPPPAVVYRRGRSPPRRT